MHHSHFQNQKQKLIVHFSWSETNKLTSQHRNNICRNQKAIMDQLKQNQAALHEEVSLVWAQMG